MAQRSDNTAGLGRGLTIPPPLFFGLVVAVAGPWCNRRGRGSGFVPGERLELVKTQTGVVKKWLSEKGFGFLEIDGSPGSAIFCHWRAIQLDGFKELREGERVQFSVEETPKGLKAANVFLLEGETPAA